ncbi:protein orm1 [Moniliophthora roreri]|nr:protein orm1 [Moniliophthora roreri]
MSRLSSLPNPINGLTSIHRRRSEDKMEIEKRRERWLGIIPLPWTNYVNREPLKCLDEGISSTSRPWSFPSLVRV